MLTVEAKLRASLARDDVKRVLPADLSPVEFPRALASAWTTADLNSISPFLKHALWLCAGSYDELLLHALLLREITVDEEQGVPLIGEYTNVSCDGCGLSPLIGKRFKCDHCPNYDLCLACLHKEVHVTAHPKPALTLIPGGTTPISLQPEALKEMAEVAMPTRHWLVLARLCASACLWLFTGADLVTKYSQALRIVGGLSLAEPSRAAVFMKHSLHLQREYCKEHVPTLLRCLQNVAVCAMRMNNVPEALRYYREFYDRATAANSGPTFLVDASYSAILHKLNQREEAARLLDRVVKSATTALQQDAEVADELIHVTEELLGEGFELHAAQILDLVVAHMVRTRGDQDLTTARTKLRLATCYSNLRQLEKARVLMESAFTVLKEKQRGDPVEVASAAQKLGVLYCHHLGKREEGKRLLQSAASAQEQAIAPIASDLAASWESLAVNAMMDGDVSSACTLGFKAVSLLRLLFGEFSDQLSQPLQNLSVALMKADRLPEARDCLEKALAIRTRNNAPHDPATFRTKCLLTQLAIDMHDRTTVQRLVADVVETMQHFESAADAECALPVAAMLNKSEDFDLAWRILAPLPDTSANVVQLKAVNMSKQGRYAEAVPLLRREVALREREQDTSALFLARINLAVCLAQGGALAEAMVHVRSARDAMNELDADSIDTRSLVNLATLLHQSGRRDYALHFLEVAFNVLCARGGKEQETPEMAAVLQTMAVVLRYDHPDAESMARRALAIRLKWQPPGHPEVAFCKTQLASVLAVASPSSRSEAARLFQEAYEAMRGTLGPAHHHTLDALRNVGESHFHAREYGAAVAALEEVIRAEGSKCDATLALALYRLGKVPEAQAMMSECVREDLVGLSELLATNAEGALMEIIANRQGYVAAAELLYMMAASGGKLPDAEDWLLRAAWSMKHLALGALEARQAALVASADERVRTGVARLRELHKLSAYLKKQRAMSRDQAEELRAAYSRAFQESEMQGEQLAHLLHRLNPARNFATDVLGARRAQLGVRLGAAALLEYVRLDGALGDAEYVCVAAYRNESESVCVRAVRLGPAKEVEAAVDALQRHLVAKAGPAPADGAARSYRTVTPPSHPAYEAFVRDGRALRALVWDPVRRLLPAEARRILIAPDGALVRVSFACLPTDTPEAPYLVSRHELSYLHSGRQLLAAAPGRATGGAARSLVVANPDYDAGTTADERQRGGLLRSLEGAEAEGAEAARMLGVSPLTGANAHVDKLETYASPPFVLLASHGIFVRAPSVQAPEGERHTRTVLDAMVSSSHSAIFYQERWHASLARSAIALSGANAVLLGKRDPVTDAAVVDGLLTALDLSSRLRLQDTLLVVMSCCDSALAADAEEAPAEGPQGLIRQLLAAGAQTVVGALWSLPDADTHALIRELFDKVLTHDPGRRSQALALAQRLLCDRFPRDPWRWAAMVCYGAFEPVPTLRTRCALCCLSADTPSSAGARRHGLGQDRRA